MKLADYLDARPERDSEVAEALGITPAHLSRLRNGVGGCSLTLAVKIERWSGGVVTPADLLPPAEGQAA
jgi:DNA-binding transcriptional regulator YdaS (Cro superfamily)